MRDAEPLFLVDNRKPQILEVDVFGDQPVGTDDNVNQSALQLVHDLLLFLGGAEPGKQFDIDREVAHPGDQRLIMLPGKNCRRAEYRTLFAVQYTLESSPQCNLGFPKSNVAAQQPLHRNRAFHIFLDLMDTAQLIVRLLILEMVFKIPLHFVIRRKSIAFDRHPLGIQCDQLIGHLVHRFFDLLSGLLPFGGMQAVQFNVRVFPRTDVLGDEVQLGDRYIKGIASGIANLDIILDNPLQFQLMDAVKDADTVSDMDDIVADGEVGQRPDFLAFALFNLLGRQGSRTQGRSQRKPDFGVFKAGRQCSGQDKHLAVLDRLQILFIACRNSHPHKVTGKVLRRLIGAGKDTAAVPLFHQRVKVRFQQFQVAVPAGILQRGKVDDILQCAKSAMCKGFQIDTTMFFKREFQHFRAELVAVQPLAELAFFQKHLDILLELHPLCPQRLFHVGIFAEKDGGVLKIVQQGRKPAGQREVLVIAVQFQPGCNPVKVFLEDIFCVFCCFTVSKAVDQLSQLFFQLTLFKQHLTCRRDRQGIQRLGPPLGIQLKIGDSVDIVAPELDTDRVGFLGRKDVQYPAADRELTDTVHLIPPDIPAPDQPGCQLLHRQLTTLIRVNTQLEGPFFQLFGSNRPRTGSLGRSDHNPDFARLNPGEDAQPLLFILARDRLHLPVAEVPGGEQAGQFLSASSHCVDIRRQPCRRQVILAQQQNRTVQVFRRGIKKMCLVNSRQSHAEQRGIVQPDILYHPSVAFQAVRYSSK